MDYIFRLHACEQIDECRSQSELAMQRQGLTPVYALVAPIESITSLRALRGSHPSSMVGRAMSAVGSGVIGGTGTGEEARKGTPVAGRTLRGVVSLTVIVVVVK